ncbi:MAG: glycosyltransferase [bacterium]
MFISYLLPYSVRNIHAPHLWIFYKQLSYFKKNEAIYIGTEDYFKDPSFYVHQDRWDIREATLIYHESALPVAQDMDSICKFTIPGLIFDELEQKLGSRREVAVFLLTQRCEKLETELDRIFSGIIKTEKPEAVLAWWNCPSLNHIAGRYGLRVIHNELGPLRKPFYKNTAYFDFSGVNGNTEAEKRFLQFKKEAKDDIAALPKKELLALLLEDDYAHLATSKPEPAYEIGLPLQVEDDSNIMAFSNNLDNRGLISMAGRFFKRDETLIRKHPAGLCDYSEEPGIMDESANSMEFLLLCKRAATINSSVGLEAILFDRITHILGDSPFAFLAHNDFNPANDGRKTEDELLKLNFLLFGYLMPYEFLFDVDYYRWRLSGPSEKEIFRLHFACYLNKRKIIQQHSFEVPGTNIGILTLKSAIRHQEWKICELKYNLRGKNIQMDQLAAEKDRLITEKDRFLAEARRQLDEMSGSWSWRVTRPVRRLSLALRHSRAFEWIDMLRRRMGSVLAAALILALRLGIALRKAGPAKRIRTQGHGPLRICFLSKEYPPETTGGLGSFTCEMAHALADLGHEVHVVTETADESDCMDGKIHVHGIVQRLRPATLFWKVFGLGRFADIMEYSRCASRRLRQVVRLYGIDVVEAGETRAEGFHYYRLLKNGPPLVQRFHTSESLCYMLNADKPSLENSLVKMLEKYWMACADRHIGISRDIVERYRMFYGMALADIPIIPNPINAAGFQTDGNRLPAERPQILFTGRFELRKGTHILIKSIPKILAKHQNARFIFIGSDCGTRSYCEKLVKNQDCEGSVVFIDRLSRHLLAKYYDESTMCVFPSLWENFPYTCLEAMSAGKPVVASRTGGFPDIIEDNVSGLLVPAGDHCALADAILKLLEDSPLLGTMGRNARKRMLDLCNPAAAATKTLEVYNRAVFGPENEKNNG